MAVTGQTGTHAPQSMHSAGSIYSCVASAKFASSLRGWMQSTGHTSTQAVSLVPMQGSAITYAMFPPVTSLNPLLFWNRKQVTFRQPWLIAALGHIYWRRPGLAWRRFITACSYVSGNLLMRATT